MPEELTWTLWPRGPWGTGGINVGKSHHVEFLPNVQETIIVQTLKVLSQGHAMWGIVNLLKSSSWRAMGPGIDST